LPLYVGDGGNQFVPASQEVDELVIDLVDLIPQMPEFLGNFRKSGFIETWRSQGGEKGSTHGFIVGSRWDPP